MQSTKKENTTSKSRSINIKIEISVLEIFIMPRDRNQSCRKFDSRFFVKKLVANFTDRPGLGIRIRDKGENFDDSVQPPREPSRNLAQWREIRGTEHKNSPWTIVDGRKTFCA